MELNSQTNVFHKGLDMDSDVSMLPEGKYRYAENIRFVTNDNGTTGVLQNIEHIRKYTIGLPQDEVILGTSNTLLYDKEKKQTYEVGVVVTKKIVNDHVYNTVYVVRGFDSLDLETLPIVKGYLDLEKNVNIVCNYESNNVSNIYITDGLTPIKVINIEEQINIPLTEVSDPTRFDITPGSVLIPFNFVNRINGVLPAGAVQYAYQLFNMHGGSTPISALSDVIPIVKKAVSSKNTQGGIKGDITDMGCQIKASFMNDGRFDRMRIYSIVYLNNTSVPNIYIANEIKIPSSLEYEFIECTYNDSGNGYMSQITIDEFNALIPYEFSAKSIEKLQNRLFASNVEEITWDVDFDARAYRCDKNGIIQLHSGTGDTIHGILKSNGEIYDLTGITKLTIPEEHDCVNPSNVNVLENDQEYTYGVATNGNKFRGGTGPNVSYKFTYTPLILSQAQTSANTLANTINFDCEAIATELKTYYEDGTLCKITSTNGQNIIPNYSDPYVCANFLGYQRDEIYRFGIIFYNNKNIPSPVHWIGDIKMPATYYDKYTGSKIYPFHCGEDGYEMVAYALGLEFTVKNIPKEAYAYEIVRCDRTQNDRTIVCQGALSATMAYTHFGKEDNNYGSIDTRPMYALMLPKGEYRMWGYWGSYEWEVEKVREDCFEFASPEVCIGGENATTMIAGGYLNPLYYATSYSESNAVKDEQFGKPVTAITPIQLYDIAESDDTITTNLYYQHGGMSTRAYGNKLWFCIGPESGSGDQERCAVMKYYINQTSNQILDYDKKTHYIDDAIVSRMIPLQRDFDDLRNYVQFVGKYGYVNSAFHIGSINSNHGICGVITVKDFDKFINLTTTTSDTFVKLKFNEFNTTAICNIKRNITPYNGNGYVNRQTNVYQSCGCFNSSDMEAQPVLCFGGDTYLNIFDYQNTVVTQTGGNDIASYDVNKICHVSYIPLESVVNLNYRTADSFNKLSSGNTGENRIQVEPMTYQSWVQEKPLYEYNSVYSVQSGSKQYIPKSIYAEDNMLNGCRIMCSEAKTNNEITDSWTVFKVANYLDVDTKHGPITNLKSFKNRLYFWQSDAVGIAAVNERSLITDNNMAALTLGTGGILARFDYITEQNGSSIENDKSIASSEKGIYWYDFDKNVLCQLSGSVTPISKALSVQSYLNSLHSNAKKNVVSFYDHKYNEIWFRIYDKALIFNEQLSAFTSFYTHNPNWFFPFSDKLITIKDNNMYYLHNIYTVESEEQEERIAKIQFVVNKEFTNTKVFDNVSFGADFIDNNNPLPQIVTSVQFKTKSQETNPIDFNSLEVREDNYRFAIPRENSDKTLSITGSKSYPSRMRGKYLVCDYTFDCNNNKEFKLPYIKTTYRYSML